jgi:radical SAM protein with 4Fe4S-binding SPASM domain
MPCQLLYDDRFSAGNILTDTPDALAEGLKRISDMAVIRKQKDFGCSHCIMRAKCGKGCMALAFLISGDPLSSDGDCAFRKLQLIDFDMKKANTTPLQCLTLASVVALRSSRQKAYMKLKKKSSAINCYVQAYT